jgi:hypothetical protein
VSRKDFKIISGIPFPADEYDLKCQLFLFLQAPRFQKYPNDIVVCGQDCVYTGLGRAEHAKIISQILFPKTFEWHPWSERIIGRACESQRLAICGCGTSSKSTSIGVYALIWWMCSPLDSAVIMASTTIDSAKKRIWKETSRYFSIFSGLVGGYRDAVMLSSPRPCISPIRLDTRKKDEAHGMYVIAMHGKDLEAEKNYVKGFHPRRILVIADEQDALGEGGQALVEVFDENLKTGTDESQIILLGNDPSLFNGLGDAMQPEPGKPVTLEHTDWKSAKGYDCLRLDAYESPNIKGKDKWTGLVRQRDIDDLVSRKGENSPSVWIQLHGLHPPEGSSNTVLSEASLLRFHCFESVVWQRDFITSASLDPAFGGDSCIFRTFRRGNDTHGVLKILCEPPVSLSIVANDPHNPPDYQIAAKVKELCLSRGIPPDEFILDATGVGRGVAAILKREWSPRIEECNFGGAPSELPMSDENPVPANKECDRKVTELWLRIRYFVEADLIRGLDQPTAVQICSRTLEDKGTGGGRKLCIQKKDEMLHSPDEADALACAIELFIRKGVIPNITTQVTETSHKELETVMEEMDFDASPQAYSDPLLDYMDESFTF